MNWILAVLMIAAVVPFGLKNGDFRETADGKAIGWEPAKHYQVLSISGFKGGPAVELECSGSGDSSGALQVLRYPVPRKGSFQASAMIECDSVGSGGDFALWLDIIQDDGSPLWGRMAIPDRNKKGWQRVSVEVNPDKPVREIQVYLLLRGVKGRARFSQVIIEEVPLKMKYLRVYPDGDRVFQARASLSESASWKLRAVQGETEVWSKAGEGKYINQSFQTPKDEPVKVTITAENGGSPVNVSTVVKPSTNKQPVDLWVADSMTRVFQDDLPPAKPIRQAVIDAARNDRESFQVCLRPKSQDLKNVKVSLSSLEYQQSSDTAKVASVKDIPGSTVDWYRVGYVMVKQPVGHPFSPRDSAAWWPDPLLPSSNMTVKAGEVQPLWFTLHVPKDAKPGGYKGVITISADGFKPLKVPVTANVYPAIIPDQGHMKTAFALMDCYLNRIHGKISPKLRRAYTDYLLAHHLNPDDISRSVPPDIDELVYANSRGLNAFSILNVVEEPANETVWTCWSPVEAYTPEFKEKFFKKLDSYIPELEKRGLINKAYIYGFDERGPEYIPVIRDLFGEIKKRYPKVHTLSTCWPPADTDPLSLNVDWYVPLTSSYNPQMAKLVRDKGGEMWWYICLGPTYPYANWLLEYPLIESRLIWWQAFQNDVEGFLYWGLNIWEREHNDRAIPNDAGPRIDWSVTTGGNYPSLNGDGVLLYPGVDGPIGSIRLENIRDGLEDIELLKQYKQKNGEKSSEKILSRVATDRTRFTRNHEDLLKSRKTVLQGLK